MKKFMIAIYMMVGVFLSTSAMADTLLFSSYYRYNYSLPPEELWLEGLPMVPDNLNLVLTVPPPPNLVNYNPNVEWDYAVVYRRGSGMVMQDKIYSAYEDTGDDGILTAPNPRIDHISFFDDPTTLPAQVPEPASLLLLGSGLVVIGGYGRKKFFKK